MMARAKAAKAKKKYTSRRLRTGGALLGTAVLPGIGTAAGYLYAKDWERKNPGRIKPARKRPAKKSGAAKRSGRRRPPRRDTKGKFR
jgi:hypothetical protein